MRKALAFALISLFGLTVAPAARAEDSTFRVTLLGSGVPDPQPDRFSASTLVEAGDQKLIFDVGRGATIRLYQLRVPLSKIDVVFFTHYHSDHTIGMPDLLLTGWLPPAFAHRTQPMHVVGPIGAKALMAGHQQLPIAPTSRGASRTSISAGRRCRQRRGVHAGRRRL